MALEERKAWGKSPERTAAVKALPLILVCLIPRLHLPGTHSSFLLF